MLLKIKGLEINLALSLPLTGRDWKELEKAGVRFGPSDSGNAGNIIGLVLYVANKGTPPTTVLTIDDVEALPIARIVEAAAFIRSEGMEKDDPNS